MTQRRARKPNNRTAPKNAKPRPSCLPAILNQGAVNSQLTNFVRARSAVANASRGMGAAALDLSRHRACAAAWRLRAILRRSPDHLEVFGTWLFCMAMLGYVGALIGLAQCLRKHATAGST